MPTATRRQAQTRTPRDTAGNVTQADSDAEQELTEGVEEEEEEEDEEEMEDEDEDAAGE
jgi:hypothetical protein